MRPADRKAFAALLADVYCFYPKQGEFSEFALNVWWAAMQPFDYPAVADALNRHAVNPDNGQFLPKPADVVKLLGGSNLDRATLAWTKALQAIHHVGTYDSVCFDDPIINVVILEMGGWIQLGLVVEKELPFKQREFELRYRAYLTKGSFEDYPRELPGIFARDNSARGFIPPKPRLIGDPEKAAKVYLGGGDGVRLRVANLQDVLPQLENKSRAA
jgi:hypothetical protein